MNRKTFLTTVAGLVVLPGVALAVVTAPRPPSRIGPVNTPPTPPRPSRRGRYLFGRLVDDEFIVSHRFDYYDCLNARHSVTLWSIPPENNGALWGVYQLDSRGPWDYQQEAFGKMPPTADDLIAWWTRKQSAPIRYIP